MLVVWDYFGVMAQDGFWYESRSVADGFHRSVHMRQVADEVDLGHMSWDEFCVEVSKDIRVPVELVEQRFSEHRINRQVVETILALKKRGHTSVLLSNASHEYLLPIMHKLGTYVLFDRVFVSSEIGLMKPDPDIFRYVLAEMAIDASGAIMVDDSARNIDAAQLVGMRGVVYEPGMDIKGCVLELVA